MLLFHQVLIVSISSVNFGSNDVNRSLKLNSGDSAKGDSGDIWMRINVLSSGIELSLMVEVGSRDYP